MIVFEKVFQFVLPHGIISSAGIRLIQAFIGGQDLRIGEWAKLNPQPPRSFLQHLPDDWNWQWLVERGEYRGNFPRRASAYYHRHLKLRCPENFLSELGNLARTHSESEESYTMEFTRNLLWKRGAFGDMTCWHEGQKQCLMDANGFAVRFYKDGKGFGRAWMYSPEDSVYITFNGYGYESVQIARIVAAYLKMEYKAIDVTIDGDTGGFMYVNDRSGFVIGTAETIEGYDDYDIECGCYYSTCDRCGGSIEHEDDEYPAPNGDRYCRSCYDEYVSYCDNCGHDRWADDMTYVESIGESVCDSCLEHYFTDCHHCEETYRSNALILLGEHLYCEACIADLNIEGDNIE
jgi:hypothetical protein